MKNVNAEVLNISDAATVNGGKIDASQIYSATFHAIWTDSDAAGTVKIQASNDLCPPGNLPSSFTPTNWIDIPSASATITAAAGNQKLIALTPAVGYRWLRIVWTQTTPGSGLIKVNMFAICV